MNALTVACGLLPVAVAPAHAAVAVSSGVEFSYLLDGAPVTLTVDAHGTVQVDGLPTPGLVLYRPQEAVLYYQHPNHPRWLMVGREQLAGYILPLDVRPGAPWSPWQGQPTRRWQLEADATPCGDWFGSTHAAAVAGMTALDFWRILAGIQLINSGQAALPCDRALPDMAEGDRMGLPVKWLGSTLGNWELESMVRVPVPKVALPTDVEPVTDHVRLGLLMGQLGMDERADFARQYGRLPTARQLEEVERILSDSAAP